MRVLVGLIVFVVPLASANLMGRPVHQITLVEVASGLDRPVAISSSPDGACMYILEQGGRVLLYEQGVIQDEPALDISALISTGAEQGLLDLAFHPAFAANNRVFISYTDLVGTLVVAEYAADERHQINQQSARIILQLAQPHQFHNGGALEFGPDGYLYIGVGDGGWPGAAHQTGQDTDTWFGSILRVDIDPPTADLAYGIPPDNPFVDGGGSPEIWHFGLRNPWRISFDSATGDLYIADVGHLQHEEVNRQRVDQAGGMNFGWNLMEGSTCFEADQCDRTGLTLPIVDYRGKGGRAGNCAIIGGEVYRGLSVRALHGSYVYGDFCSGRIWSFSANSPRPSPLLQIESGVQITSFGSDGRGELWLTDYRGSLYRIHSRDASTSE